jgi:hypothetical protein
MQGGKSPAIVWKVSRSVMQSFRSLRPSLSSMTTGIPDVAPLTVVYAQPVKQLHFAYGCVLTFLNACLHRMWTWTRR